MGRKKKSTVPGSIFARGNKLYIKFKGKQHSTGLNNTHEGRRQAELIKEKMYMDFLINHGKLPAEENITTVTIGAAVDSFLDMKKNAGRAASTLKNYRGVLKNTLGDIRKMGLAREYFRNGIPDYYVLKIMESKILEETSTIAPSSLNCNIVMLNNFLLYCQKMYRLKLFDKRLNDLKVHVPTRVVETYTAKELESIIRKARKRDEEFGLFLELMSLTGARAGETIKLTWKQIDLKRGQIGFPNKIHNTEIQYIPISSRINRVLNEIAEISRKRNKNKDKLFRWKTYHYLYKWLEEIERDLNIAPSQSKFHKFRKTFATTLVEQGAPIDIIHDLMRHSDIKLTFSLYRKKNPERLMDYMNQHFK